MGKEIDYKKALDIVSELTPSAHVLARAEQKIRDPDVDIDSLIDVLKTDPVITADIIRISNSVHYGLESPSTDLKTSVNQIGFDEVIKILGLIISRQMASHKLSHYGLSDVQFWSESVSKALIMEFLARKMDFNPSVGYTIGLLSEIGKLIIDQALDRAERDDVYDGSVPVNQWEKTVIGFDYGYAGAMLLKQWEFPSDFIEAVLVQFKPELGEFDQAIPQALGLAHMLIEQTGADLSNSEIAWNQKLLTLLSNYNLEESFILSELKKARERLSSIKVELGVK